MLKNKDKIDQTLEWQEYQAGLNFKQQYSYKTIGDRNERFLGGDQWLGVNFKDLIPITINLLKKIANTHISIILKPKIRIRYVGVSTEYLKQEDDILRKQNELNGLPNEAPIDWDKRAWKDGWLDSLAKEQWEKDKIEYKLRADTLKHGTTYGNYCFHVYWDSNKSSFDDNEGDFCTEVLHPINVFFGDGNNPDVDNQPYIIIKGRKPVEDIKRMARANKLSEKEIEKIVADSDTTEEAGDRSQQEVSNTKATYLIKYWKQNGFVWCKMSTKNVVFRPNFNTNLTLYPLTWGYWEKRDSSYLGEALLTSLIPAQMCYNRQISLAIKSSTNMAYPKLIYDKARCNTPSNQVGQAIGVNGDPNTIMKIMQGAGMDSSAVLLPDKIKDAMYDISSLTGAVLGTERPENTSALLLMTGNATKNLDNQSMGLYSTMEDLGKIWLDFIRKKYSNRKIFYETQKGLAPVKISEEDLKSLVLKTKIDITPPVDFTDKDIIDNFSNMTMNRQFPVEMLVKKLHTMGALTNEEMKYWEDFQEKQQQMQPQPPVI